MVKDYQGLNDAKKEVTRSYEYSGTEKLQKCQELGEVRTCTSTAAQRSYRSARSWSRYVRVRVRVQWHRDATGVPTHVPVTAYFIVTYSTSFYIILLVYMYLLFPGALIDAGAH